MFSPAIQEVMEAYEWTQSDGNGRLEQLYPAGIPNILIRALLIFSRGAAAGKARSLEKAKEDAKRKAASG